MKTVLFVCTGNVCRSPMAEGLLRHAVAGRGDYRVLSAGLGAMDGQPPSAHSVTAMRELGINISAQRSRMLTTEMVQQADYIFGMTHSHVDTICLLYPKAAEKTFLLREFDDTLDPFEKDISDPIGGSYDVYVNCRDQIEQGIASLLRFIQQHDTSAGAKASYQPATVALGADHGGYELKEAIKKHLESRNVSVTDFGCYSKESTDYPDYALAVAEAVVAGKAKFGVEPDYHAGAGETAVMHFYFPDRVDAPLARTLPPRASFHPDAYCGDPASFELETALAAHLEADTETDARKIEAVLRAAGR